MNFREYCIQGGWFDKWGRFNADRSEPTPEPQSNNNLLYHSEYIAILDLNGELEEVDGEHLEGLFRLHQVVPGLIKRDPDSGLDQKHDDIVGLVCAAAITGRHDLALSILKYLRENSWVVDVKNPGSGYDPRLDISRIGGVAEIIQLCSNEALPLWQQLSLGISMVITALRSDGESGVLMDWLKFRAFKSMTARGASAVRHAPLLKLTMAIFEMIIKRDKLAMGSKFAHYFPVNGTTHPFAIYTWEKV